MFIELISQAAIGYFGSTVGTVGYTPDPDDPNPRPWPWPWPWPRWRDFLSKFVIAGAGAILMSKLVGAGLGVDSMFASSVIAMAGGKLFGDLGRGFGVVR